MVTINRDDNSQNENFLIIDQIKSLIDNSKQKDVKNQLISYAKSSGFINNVYRKQAWSLLIDPISDSFSTGIYFYDYLSINL
jgi:hypothetical protein